MASIQKIMLISLIAGLISGCGVAKRSVKKRPVSAKDPAVANSGRRPAPAMTVSKVREVKVSLQQAYRDWKGTPYVLGGESHRGIDCSAFMQRLFKQYFEVKLPRNTRRQIHKGKAIRRNALTSGDLIFFKTGRRTLHVGVMLKGDTFLHASTSQGVTISSLNDYYWKSRYLAARRVLQF